MLVFLDTEFTDLAKPELLSLGTVAINGLEHYGELDLATDVGQARRPATVSDGPPLRFGRHSRVHRRRLQVQGPAVGCGLPPVSRTLVLAH